MQPCQVVAGTWAWQGNLQGRYVTCHCHLGRTRWGQSSEGRDLRASWDSCWGGPVTIGTCCPVHCQGAEECFLIFFGFFVLFCFVLPFRVSPVAYGDSQAWGRMGLQLLAYATDRDTAMQDPSCICNLYHISQQRLILNPLSEARNRSRILMDASQVRYHCSAMGTPALDSGITFLSVLERLMPS